MEFDDLCPTGYLTIPQMWPLSQPGASSNAVLGSRMSTTTSTMAAGSFSTLILRRRGRRTRLWCRYAAWLNAILQWQTLAISRWDGMRLVTPWAHRGFERQRFEQYVGFEISVPCGTKYLRGLGLTDAVRRFEAVWDDRDCA